MSNDFFHQKRKELLAHARGEILEIGLGTGLNIPHYPPHVKKITATEINPGMNKYAQEKAKKYHIEIAQHLVSSSTLPFPANTFNTVVSTWTLCSVNDLSLMLSEIHRVLKPDGKFIFLEHCLNPRKSIQNWQNRLNPFWKKLALGCNLNRDFKKALEANSFEITSYQEFIMPRSLKLTELMCQGVAFKKAPK